MRVSSTGSLLSKSTQKHSNAPTSFSSTPLTPRYILKARKLLIPDAWAGVHGEPDREESGDFGDGDHPSQDQNGIRNSAHSIPDHQLDVGVQQR